MKMSASADLFLKKTLNTCRRSTNQMPGTKNVLEFLHVVRVTVYVATVVLKKMSAP